MRNVKMLIQYEGSRYQGWQKQDSTDNTIQGKFEAILSKLCGRKTEIQASGRTDAGVHAYGQIANFHTEIALSLTEIMNYCNRYLPEDIAVTAIEEVGERFHSRLSARGKTYRYRVLNTEIPHIFDRRYVYQMAGKLNIQAMQAAALQLVGRHDFRAFTSNKRSKKSTVRTLDEITIQPIGSEIIFTYKGDGFLYHMVRILTGTLLEIGIGAIGVDEITAILESGLRENAGSLVPPQGLALMEVYY